MFWEAIVVDYLFNKHGVGHGDAAIQASSNVNFIYEDSDDLNLNSIANACLNFDASMLGELAEHSRTGQFVNIDTFYNAGISKSWSRGVSALAFIKGKFGSRVLPLELANAYKDILKKRTDYDGVDYASVNKTFDRLEIELRTLDKSTLLKRIIDDDIKNLKGYIGSEDVDFIQEELFIIITGFYNISGLGGKTSNTYSEDFSLILKYDKEDYPDIDKTLDPVIASKFFAAPSIPMFENESFSRKSYVYDDWKSVDDSNMGHTVVPRHLRKERRSFLSTEEQKLDIQSNKMLNKLGVPHEQIINIYLEGSKYPTFEEGTKRQIEYDAFNQKTNSNLDINSEEDLNEIINDISNYEKLRRKILCFELEPNTKYEKEPIPEEVLRKWDELRNAQLDEVWYPYWLVDRPTLSQENRYFSFYANEKEDYEKGKIKERIFMYTVKPYQMKDPTDDDEKYSLDKTLEFQLKSIYSMYASVGLNLFSKSQEMRRAVFHTFKFFKENIVGESFSSNEVKIEMQEKNYRKRFSYQDLIMKNIPMNALQKTIIQKNLNKREFYKTKVVDNRYIITEYKYDKSKKEHVITEITVIKFSVKTYVKRYNKHYEEWKSDTDKATVGDKDSESKLFLPLINNVWNKTGAIDRTILSKKAVYIEMVSAPMIRLKWYQTPHFIKVFKIYMRIAQVALIIATLGSGAEFSQIAFDMIVEYLMYKGVEWLAKKLGPGPLRTALMILYTAYLVYRGRASRTNMSGIQSASAYTDVFLKVYALDSEIAMQELNDDWLEYKDIVDEKQEEINSIDEMLESGSMNYIPKAETSEEFYDRTLAYPLEVDYDIDAYYDEKLNYFN